MILVIKYALLFVLPFIDDSLYMYIYIYLYIYNTLKTVKGKHEPRRLHKTKRTTPAARANRKSTPRATIPATNPVSSQNNETMCINITYTEY